MIDLTPLDQANRLNSPPLQGRGRGWGLSAGRLANHDVMQNIEGVCAAILGALEEALDRWANPHPNPSPEGEGLSNSQGQEF